MPGGAEIAAYQFLQAAIDAKTKKTGEKGSYLAEKHTKTEKIGKKRQKRKGTRLATHQAVVIRTSGAQDGNSHAGGLRDCRACASVP